MSALATPIDGLTGLTGVPGRIDVKRPARVAEVWLLLVALTAGIGGFALVGYGVHGSLPPGFARDSMILVAIAVAGHIAVRIAAPFADQVILPTVVFLNGIGLAMILRIQESGDRGAAGANMGRNILWSALGAMLAVAVLFVLKDHRALRKFTYTSLIVSLVLLVSPLAPGIGHAQFGSRRWIRVGDFSFQPAEIAKITLVIFFAGYLVANRDALALAGRKVLGIQFPRFREFGPMMLAWATSLGVLVFQQDLGTSLLLFGTFVAVLYLATDRISWIVIGGGLFAVGAFVATQHFWHVQQRMDGWLHAMDPAVFNRVGGSGQLVRGLFGLANGGMFGTGWGRGHPYLVPFSFSDFIYTSLGEELGLTGALAILMAFVILCERAMRTALTLRDGFGKLLAGGLAFALAVQVFVVVGGVTRLLPLSGLTLPFMAQGGASLISSWIIAGLLLRLSNDARRPSPQPFVGQVAS